MLAYIPPAFNKLCIDGRRSMIAIVSIIIGTASVILLVSAIVAFQQVTDAPAGEFTNTVTTAGGGEYQAMTTHNTFATDHTLFSSYRSLHAIEDLTAVMTMTLAFVLGVSVLLTLVFVGLHYGIKALANMPKFDLSSVFHEQSTSLQYMIESTILTIAGSIIGIVVAFVSAGYVNQILSTINLRIHMPSIALSIILTLAIVVTLRTQRSRVM